MKTAITTQLKKELAHHSQKDLIEFCLRLSKFKKENKEFLTYLLFEAGDDEAFILCVKKEVKLQFKNINTDSYYFIKKRIRKILRFVKKYIRYSKINTTQIELLLYFCYELKKVSEPIAKNATLQSIFDKQIVLIKKAIAELHEDLQFDYNYELESLLD